MKKRWIAGLAALALVIVIGTTILILPTVRVFAQACISAAIDIFKNTETDYVEPVEIEAETTGVTLELKQVAREWNEVKIDYTLTFEDDISEFLTMGEDAGYKTVSVFYEEPFNDCIININGYNLHGGNELGDQVCVMPEDFFYYEVNDLSITEHVLEQEIVLYLNDGDFAGDLNILLDYSNIKVGDKVLTGDMIVEYLLKGGKYQGDIEQTPLTLNTVATNGAQYNITGYAITNTGLKLFADNIQDTDEDITITFFIAKDNLGNQYLYYPKYDGNKMTFTIYDGAADEHNNYLNYLDKNATSLTMALYEEASDEGAGICGTKQWEEFFVWYWDHYYENAIQLSKEFTIDLVAGTCQISDKPIVTKTVVYPGF